jgi:hypothetical protein
MMMYFLAGANKAVNSVTLKDFTVNKNGVTSPAPAGATDYTFEQAHAIAIASDWTNASIENVVIENVTTEDKIGGGVVLTQGYLRKVRIHNLNGINYQHVGGQRGDFEFQAAVSDLQLTACTGLYTQCEPNLTSAPAGLLPVATFTDCTYGITECTAYINTPDAQTLNLVNHTATNLALIRWLRLNVSRSTLRVSTSSNTYWEGTSQGSSITDSKMIVAVNTTTNAFDPFYPKSAATMPTYLKLKNVAFIADSTANSTTTGYAVFNSSAYSGAQPYLVEFEDVSFDAAFERTANCFNAGNFNFLRCKLAARAGSLGALSIGGSSTFFSKVVLDSNDLSQLAAQFIQFTATNTLWSVTFRGVHDFAASTFSTSNAANTTTCTLSQGVFTSTAIPTVKGIQGWLVRLTNPVFGAASEFICTTTSSASPVYKMTAQAGVVKDVTANRPAGLTLVSGGLRYLDTTLVAAGKPIVWTGTAWVDSVGVVV